MRRIILYIGSAIALIPLTACGNVGGSVDSAATVAATVADAAGAPKPTPCVNTTIDEKALTVAASAVDVAALSASALVRAHVIEPGTPRAVSLATGLDAARDGVHAADEARKACNATSYTEAVARVRAAVADIKQAIGN